MHTITTRNNWGLILLLTLLMLAPGCRSGSSGDDDAADDDDQSPPDLTATFVGSQICRSCHQNKYAQWAEDLHRLTVRQLDQTPGITADANQNNQNDFADGRELGNPANNPNDAQWNNYFAAGTHPRLSAGRATWAAVTIDGRMFDVDFTLGGARWKQRYLTRRDHSGYILPMQYNLNPPDVTQHWVRHFPQHWYASPNSTVFTGGPTSPDNAWERRCLGCKVTGAQSVSEQDGEWVGEYKELGVGCEVCHGPGGRHVAFGGGRGTIINPGKLSRDRGLDLCGSCHSRGHSQRQIKAISGGGTLFFTYPWSQDNRPFRPGERLSDYYVTVTEPDPSLWQDIYNTAKYNRHQYLDLRNSKHHTLEITCWTCHDPHGSSFRSNLKDDPGSNRLCLRCHGANTAYPASGITTTSVQGHTHHNANGLEPAAGNGSLCIACHFPFTAQGAVMWDIRAHTSKPIFPYESSIVTDGTLAGTIPNSCMNGDCHTNKDISTHKWQVTNQADLTTAQGFINQAGNGHFNAGGGFGDLVPRAHILVKHTPTGNTIYDKRFSLSGNGGLPTPDITLDGGRSFDPNSLPGLPIPLTYTWTQVSGSGVTLTPVGGGQTCTVTGVTIAGTYIFSLMVTDPTGNQSMLYNVTITVEP